MLGALDSIDPEVRITLFGHRNGQAGASFAFRRNFSEDDVRVYFIKNSPFIARVGRCPIGQPASPTRISAIMPKRPVGVMLRV